MNAEKRFLENLIRSGDIAQRIIAERRAAGYDPNVPLSDAGSGPISRTNGTCR